MRPRAAATRDRCRRPDAPSEPLCPDASRGGTVDNHDGYSPYTEVNLRYMTSFDGIMCMHGDPSGADAGSVNRVLRGIVAGTLQTWESARAALETQSRLARVRRSWPPRCPRPTSAR